MTDSKKDLSERIINHLKIKQNGRDNLDNIIIAIYDNEMQNLSANILKSLSDLIQQGIIVEDKINEDSTLYRLENKL